MPRRLYPSHTGRFGGLNRQLMYARGRLNRFSDRATGRDFPQMPEGVAGEEWHPEEYKSSPMWADVEQRLHDILRNPPKFHRDPQTDAEKDEQYQAEMARDPNIVISRERNEAMLKAAGGKSEEQRDKEKDKKFKVAGTLAEGRHKVYMDMKKANATHPDTYTNNEIDTALESRNAAYREWHRVAEDTGWGDISQSFPELHKSGLTKKAQEDIDKAKIKKTALSRRQDPMLNIAYGEHGLGPDIAPGGIPPQKQIDALNKLGPMLDQQLADGDITAEQWQKRIDAIKNGKDAKERLEIAQKEVPDLANQVIQETSRPEAVLPKSLSRQAPEAGPEEPASPILGIPSPGDPMMGEGEEYLPGGEPGPEAFMESTPEQMERLPDDRYDALNMKLFNRLPAREEIGKVPSRFKTPGRRGKFPYQRGGRKKATVKEE